MMPGPDDQDADTPPERARRTGRFFAALLNRDGQPPLKVAIRNISSTGMGGRADPPPAVGEAVTIVMGTMGEVTGRIRWVNGRQFGVQLDTPIDPARFDFSGRSWTDVALADAGKTETPDAFKPMTSTWRPGFGKRGT